MTKHGDASGLHATEALESARQAEVELAILLNIERSLRIALQWTMQDPTSSRKLSTLRFHTWSFERHLTRIQSLADHGGCMQLITAGAPHLARDVTALQSQQAELHTRLGKIVLRLDLVTQEDAAPFSRICVDLESFLDDLRKHSQRERELLQHSFTQEEGGSG